jgi:glucosamine-6-phosphate deaminase
MDVKICKDYESMSAAAAQYVCDFLRDDPYATVVFPTGNTPKLMYDMLAEKNRRGEFSMSKRHIYHLDEYRGVPWWHPNSYNQYIRERVTSRMDVDMRKVHLINGNTKFPNVTCENLDVSISRRCMEGRVLYVLGSGREGHVGFNERGSGIDSRVRVVVLAQSTREANSPDWLPGPVPPEAITMGIANILEGSHRLVIANGRGKAWPITMGIEGPEDSDVPLVKLRRRDELHYIIDRESASLLKDYR